MFILCIVLVIGWIAHVLAIKSRVYKEKQGVIAEMQQKQGFFVLIQDELYRFDNQGDFLLNGNNETARYANRKGLTQLLTDLESRFITRNNIRQTEKFFYVGTTDEIIGQLNYILKNNLKSWRIIHITK
jgi:hypothetical protein|nr:MAG TPA: hypothetical protein [Bacteriophage sp.]